LERNWAERYVGASLDVAAVATVKLASGSVARWIAKTIRNPHCLATSRALIFAVTLMNDLGDACLNFGLRSIGVD
jgi:hypothetical protein